MKIAIDRGPLESGHKVRGVGVYTKELISSLKKLEYNIHDVNFNEVNLTKYDIIHYPYFELFFRTLPFKKPTKIVVTVHDLIPLIYPKFYPPGLKGYLRFNIQRYLLKKADAIITVSETSKKDIVRFLGVDADRITVVRLAPTSAFKEISNPELLKHVKTKYKLPGKFVLYVGDVNYNKNIPGLLKAISKANLPLVICGKQANEIEDVAYGLKTISGPRDWIRYVLGKPHPEAAHIDELREGFRNPLVKRLGFVPEDELVAIYNLATLYCQPSFYEGFGIPVLEAMACGCPVVIARNNSLIELTGSASLIANPKSTDDLAEKLMTLFENSSLRATLIHEGKNRIKEFSWRKTAEETAEVYKKVISAKHNIVK